MSGLFGSPDFKIAVSPDAIVSRVLGFTHLPSGWDYGRGRRIHPQVAFSALLILSEFKVLGARTVEAFPRVGGGILVSGYCDDYTVDAALGPDLRVGLYVEKGDLEAYSAEGLSIKEMFKVIGDNNWLSKDISGSSTPFTISVASYADSSLQVLKSHLTTMGSQLYSSHVYTPAKLPYVNIFQSFTPAVLPASRQYSGDSAEIYSQKAA